MINLVDIYCVYPKILRTLLFYFCFRVAVVTGGNRGIGLEICRQLASKGVTVVLTARDEKRGAEAVKIFAAHGLTNVLFHQLEVGDLSSVARLADFIREKFSKLDILYCLRFLIISLSNVTILHVKYVGSELIMNHW
jgi:enoyl-[acyl-carrier-protein] reductase (NADH)